jgi:hypothetical protein
MFPEYSFTSGGSYPGYPGQPSQPGPSYAASGMSMPAPGPYPTVGPPQPNRYYTNPSSQLPRSAIHAQDASRLQCSLVPLEFLENVSPPPRDPVDEQLLWHLSRAPPGVYVIYFSVYVFYPKPVVTADRT